jgi:thiol-disulfide isomerase/thioredoxin
MVPRSILSQGAFPRAFFFTLIAAAGLTLFAERAGQTSQTGTQDWREEHAQRAQSPLAKSAKTKAKQPAPRFNARTTGGEKFSNDSIKGKVVLLEFWTTWCGFCADEAPFVDKIAHEFADKGLIVLAVNVGESKKTVKKYLDVHPRDCKIVLMEDTNLAAMYVATAYPIYVVIDRDGFIAATQRGAGGEDALRDLLASAGLESAEAVLKSFGICTSKNGATVEPACYGEMRQSAADQVGL